MAINDWWAGDPGERYWMEITDREHHLGDELNAPTLNGAGREEWSYTLVSETQPGDIVLHWHKKLVGRPALVGWSVVTGPLSIDEGYTWLAHGTRGRARGVPTTGLGWRMPCGGLNRLPHPVTDRRLAELGQQLRAGRTTLAQQVRGALYFPFTIYKTRPVSAAQAYLTKFPASLFQLMPELADIAPLEHLGQEPDGGIKVVHRSVGTRHLRDSKLKKAIEQYAVERARRHYMNLGATEIKELGKPYDLRVSGLGRERHVEVKGSSVAAVAVELTLNEVAHARNHTPTDLVVVDEIDVQRTGHGYALSGGQFRIWSDWWPEQAHLSPTIFRYDLPTI